MPILRKTKKPGRAKTIPEKDLEKVFEKSEEEVQNYFEKFYSPFNDRDLIDPPSTLEINVALAYINSGFNLSKAGKEVWDSESDHNARRRVRRIIDKERVKKFISHELHCRRVAKGITFDWVVKKYLTWATLDITQFIELHIPKEKKLKPFIVLKDSLDDLPELVRQSIKSISVDKAGKVKLEFIDQKSAMDQLCKLYGFDRSESDGQSSIHLHFDSQDREA